MTETKGRGRSTVMGQIANQMLLQLLQRAVQRRKEKKKAGEASGIENEEAYAGRDSRGCKKRKDKI